MGVCALSYAQPVALDVLSCVWRFDLVSRTRRSARQAGAHFERDIADHLAEVWDDRIDRKVKSGAKDKGDIVNLRLNGFKIAVECKDVARQDISGWVREAHKEAVNLGATVGIVVAKRHGKADPAEQWVHMTVGDFVTLLTIAQVPPNRRAGGVVCSGD